MARTTDARERAIRTAAHLFQRQGYAATGITQILTESGAPKGSFYFHFPNGKAELANQAIRFAGDRMDTLIASVLDANPKPADAVRELGATWATWLAGSDYTEGCPITTVALEQVPASAELHTTCAAIFTGWRTQLTDHFERAGIEAPRSSQLATLVLSAFEGAFVLARTLGDTTAFTDCAELAIELLNAEPNQRRGDADR